MSAIGLTGGGTGSTIARMLEGSELYSCDSAAACALVKDIGYGRKNDVKNIDIDKSYDYTDDDGNTLYKPLSGSPVRARCGLCPRALLLTCCSPHPLSRVPLRGGVAIVLLCSLGSPSSTITCTSAPMMNRDQVWSSGKTPTLALSTGGKLWTSPNPNPTQPEP